LLPLAGLLRITVEGALGVRILIVNSHVEPFVLLAGLAKETGCDAREPCRLSTTRAGFSLYPFAARVPQSDALPAAGEPPHALGCGTTLIVGPAGIEPTTSTV